MNDRQRRFAQEYIVDLNATQAAIRAGYSAKTAYSAGQRALKDVEIAAEIARLQGERGERTQLTADRVLLELGRLGMSDVRRLFTPSGALIPIEDLDDDTAAAVASVEVVTQSAGVDADGNKVVEHVHKVKLWDKNSALDKIAKHFGMFIERQEVTGPDGGPQQHEHKWSLSDEAREALADIAREG
jgi:phage terminase small subunit